MHVFIDTTSMSKLEEANNNIRCQKIMFTSVSHEFRTPLNGIINFYSLIEHRFKVLEQQMLQDIPDCKQILSRHSQPIKKFLKLGG